MVFKRALSGLWNSCAPPFGCPYVDANGWSVWKEDRLLNGDCFHAALLVRLENGNLICARNFLVLPDTIQGRLEFNINDTRPEDNDGSITVKVVVLP